MFLTCLAFQLIAAKIRANYIKFEYLLWCSPHCQNFLSALPWVINNAIKILILVLNSSISKVLNKQENVRACT